jgi:hypothetical protein
MMPPASPDSRCGVSIPISQSQLLQQKSGFPAQFGQQIDATSARALH